MVSEGVKGSIAAAAGYIFIGFLAVWFGCFFGIFYPYVREFHPATCTYKTSFQFYVAREHGVTPTTGTGNF